MKSYYSRRWYQKWWGLLIIVFILLFLIVAISSLLYYNQARQKILSGKGEFYARSGEIYDPTLLRQGEVKYSLGKKDAPLTLVVFEDFNCPYCKEGYYVMKEIYQKYPNNIRIIHRDFPFISQESPTLALAARCAGEQGRFWLMAEIMYKNQGVFELTELPDMAESIGVDREQFSTCLEEQRYLNEIQKDIEDAAILDIKATPTYFFQEYKASGLMPKESFEATVESMLENLKNQN
ncbi:MAG: DsbA family protein [Candidatus Pacebacteria bacterium]|nr:DsbA family protein [Candidatus Paceibacterota bacterium]